ncbi:UNVERIFIED_CONTAM: hypothetical protein GTU68_034552 [Idotea baltica]|nr:hypothetical protein [Idotea baltica]
MAIAFTKFACEADCVADLTALLDDLRAEGDELDQVVSTLAPEQWASPTPAEGWTIATQIAHLTWTDEVAYIAATDEAAFTHQLDAALADIDGFVDKAAADIAATDPAELLPRWRAGRKQLVTALGNVPDGTKLPWFGPPMSAASMVTARLMETWAHGQDVGDALGVEREPTARLRNIAHIGVRTRDFAFVSNDLEPPAEPFLVELSGPDGILWTWGPADAAQQVRGPAADFALLVTQRRHLDDLSLVGTGSDAQKWLTIAQAFAGPPGGGRAAGQFGTTAQ